MFWRLWFWQLDDWRVDWYDCISCSERVDRHEYGVMLLIWMIFTARWWFNWRNDGDVFDLYSDNVYCLTPMSRSFACSCSCVHCVSSWIGRTDESVVMRRGERKGVSGHKDIQGILEGRPHPHTGLHLQNVWSPYVFFAFRTRGRKCWACQNVLCESRQTLFVSKGLLSLRMISRLHEDVLCQASPALCVFSSTVRHKFAGLFCPGVVIQQNALWFLPYGVVHFFQVHFL